MKKPRKEKESIEKEAANFAKDVEKASEPIMDRARQIKEEVTQATGEIKMKPEKLMEAGDKFVNEAHVEAEAEPVRRADFRERYGLRGKKLAGLLAAIVLMVILAVYGKITGARGLLM